MDQPEAHILAVLLLGTPSLSASSTSALKSCLPEQPPHSSVPSALVNLPLRWSRPGPRSPTPHLGLQTVLLTGTVPPWKSFQPLRPPPASSCPCKLGLLCFGHHLSPQRFACWVRSVAGEGRSLPQEGQEEVTGSPGCPRGRVSGSLRGPGWLPQDQAVRQRPLLHMPAPPHPPTLGYHLWGPGTARVPRRTSLQNCDPK